MAVRPMAVGVAALIFGIVGLAFFWWVPFGQVLALAGLVLGFIGWMMARRGTPDLGVTIAATILCAAILAFDLFIAFRGMELIQFTALR
jgi:hypothetical protein